MKQLNLIVIFLFLITLAWAQVSPSKSYRIQDATTLFGQNISVGYQIVNIQTGEIWVAMSLCIPTENLNTGDVQLISAAALTDFTGEQYKRDWPSNYTMTGNVESAFVYRFYTPPTLTCGITGYSAAVEVGTSNVMAVEGATINDDHMTNGEIWEDGEGIGLLRNFGVSLTYSEPFLYEPKQTPTGPYEEHYYRFYATQDYAGVETGTATSPKRSIYAYYPYMYVESSTDYSTDLTGFYADAIANGGKIISSQGTKTIPFNNNATNEYFYIACDATYATIALIKDHNNFDVTSTFVQTTPAAGLTSTGLTYNWNGVSYEVYKTIGFANTEGATWNYIISY